MGLSGPTAAPLSLQGGTLPVALLNVPYLHDISALANGGQPPYSFSLVSGVGPNSYAVSGIGVISGTPTDVDVRITNTGDYRGTSTGDLRTTT